MTRTWETAEELTLGERLFPTEEAFPDHIKLMRYRSQLALGISIVMVIASFLLDLFQPIQDPSKVWVLRSMLVGSLIIIFLASRSSVISLPRLYALTYIHYFTLAFFFALIVVFGKQTVLFTAFHTIIVGILLRPLSGPQVTVTLGLVVAGAMARGFGIANAKEWREFIAEMLVLLGTCFLVQAVADMNFKLLVAEGEARQRMEDAMRKMNFLSSFDHLTRVMNRRNFEDALENALLEARSAGQGLGYLEIDLDYFKDINDTYGHQAGDAVLRAASERIASCLRTGDLVGRMGGDEFAAAIKAATTDVAERVAARILECFKQTPVRTSWGDIPISCTIGIGCYPGKGAATASAVMAAADTSLYEAKEAGRGRVGRPVLVSDVEHAPVAESYVPGVGMPSLEISAASPHLLEQLNSLDTDESSRSRPESGTASRPRRARKDGQSRSDRRSDGLQSAEGEGSHEVVQASAESPVPPPPHRRGGGA